MAGVDCLHQWATIAALHSSCVEYLVDVQIHSDTLLLHRPYFSKLMGILYSGDGFMDLKFDTGYVRKQENKQELFNPHCKSLLLLECIREKCNCSDSDGGILDLMDDSGNVANISDPENLTEDASQFLEGRGIYILIKITKYPSEKDPNKYEALLENLENIHPDLAERLETMSRPTQQTSSKDKKFQSAKKRGILPHISKIKSGKRNSIAKLA